MKILNAIRSRVSGDPADAGQDEAASPGAAKMPIDRYDRLDAKDVNAELRHQTQGELATIESYERSHQDRDVVLGKLRYLRGNEPVKGYDDLTPEEIASALEGADLDTLGAVREYERKFHRRPQVLKALEDIRRQRLSTATADSRPGKETS